MLITEYMSGGDLWHALGRPAVSRAVFGWHVWGHKVAIDLARGLHFLHSRVPSIVHFDLKVRWRSVCHALWGSCVEWWKRCHAWRGSMVPLPAPYDCHL